MLNQNGALLTGGSCFPIIGVTRDTSAGTGFLTAATNGVAEIREDKSDKR